MNINDFAVEMGYQDVKYVGEWNGYKVYRPIVLKNQTKPLCIGHPFKILVNDKEVRFSNIKESYDILEYFNSIAQKTK